MHSLVTGSGCVVLGCLMAGCIDPGEVRGPLGPFDIRTALYRIDPNDVIVLLSNGELTCGLPSFEFEEQWADLSLALCREGAQHVALTLYELPELRLGGTYQGVTTGTELVTDLLPRTASARYYGIEEAYLSEYHDLQRGYFAEDYVYLPDLGDGGQLGVEVDGWHLDGWFTFPDGGGGTLSGEFRATECAGDDQLLDIIGVDPTQYCTEIPSGSL